MTDRCMIREWNIKLVSCLAFNCTCRLFVYFCLNLLKLCDYTSENNENDCYSYVILHIHLYHLGIKEFIKNLPRADIVKRDFTLNKNKFFDQK